MIPLPDALLEEFEIPFLALTDEGNKAVPDEIISLAERLVGDGKLAYVEAEFFGGAGTQACVTWDRISKMSEALIADRAINVALRFLGVEKGDHFDAFDALELARHRSTEDWASP